MFRDILGSVTNYLFNSIGGKLGKQEDVRPNPESLRGGTEAQAYGSEFPPTLIPQAWIQPE